jgi:hypothetical protein
LKFKNKKRNKEIYIIKIEFASKKEIWHNTENLNIGKIVTKSNYYTSSFIYLIYSDYRDKEPFDWYQRYSGIKDIITQYIQPTF